MTDLAGKRVRVLEDLHRHGTHITVHATLDSAKARARTIADEIDRGLPEEVERALQKTFAQIDDWREDAEEQQQATYLGTDGEAWQLLVAEAEIEAWRTAARHDERP